MVHDCECCGIEGRPTKLGKMIVHGRVYEGWVCDECNVTDDEIPEILGEDW